MSIKRRFGVSFLREKPCFQQEFLTLRLIGGFYTISDLDIASSMGEIRTYQPLSPIHDRYNHTSKHTENKEVLKIREEEMCSYLSAPHLENTHWQWANV